MNGSPSKYTVWHYVGCGCAVLLPVAEGEVEAGGATVRYTAELGETILGTGRIPSVAVELEIDCRDGFFREATWFEPIPGDAPGQEEIAEASLAGTPADEAALRAFLDHFRFCT